MKRITQISPHGIAHNQKNGVKPSLTSRPRRTWRSNNTSAEVSEIAGLLREHPSSSSTPTSVIPASERIAAKRLTQISPHSTPASSWTFCPALSGEGRA